ncbi:MAG: family 1 encapsulin nanocompartment shell protein [Vampirovibrionales bacterium]|nr:family 1 encapsulin nanocompartment shell protein [Vampirovibrionales bacterium]
MAPDFLSHSEAPIALEQWQEIDNMVIDVVRRQLVGRRLLHLFGPLGAGVQSITLDHFESAGPGTLDLLGEADGQPIQSVSRQVLQLPLIYRDFVLNWRDLEASRKLDMPLDLSAAAAAASSCARAEDELIFLGYRNKAQYISYPGLLTVEGRLRLQHTDWESPGGVFNDVIRATENLASGGFYAPYAMVASPKLYAKIHRYVGGSGVMEIDNIRQIVTQGVYFSSVIPENQILIASTGVQNADLAIGQDFKTAYLGAQNMNHPFRVFESVVLRIKRPGSVCVIEGA